MHDVEASGRFKVKGDAELLTIHAFEAGIDTLKKIGRNLRESSKLPAMVSVLRLDIDNLGSHVSQHHGRDWAKLPHCPVDNPKSIKRSAPYI